jgi:hypothetical protein
MKKWIVSSIVVVALTVPGMAMPVIEFSPNPTTAGNWTYSAATHILSFDQDVVVDKGVSSNSDALVGAKVYLPSLMVSGSDGVYSLTPIGSSTIKITNNSGTMTYLTGTLGAGDLMTIGTVAGGYTDFQSDITSVVITSQGQALGSAALDLIDAMTHPSLDLQFALVTGYGGNHYHTFAEMIDGGYSCSSDFSGAMSVPEPTTIALLGMGGLALLRRYRKN